VRNSQHSILPGWLSFMLSAAFIFAAIAVIAFAYLTVQHLWNESTNPVEAAAGELIENLPSIGEGDPAAVPTIEVGGVAPNPTPTLQPAGVAGDERINILMMGIDRRSGEAFISRTDSMMVISVNPAKDSVSILSIPRDLYVQIPGQGQERINTALVYGSRNGDYLNGAALAMETVAYNLNIPVDHFIMVDFGAFTRIVDILGGIDVEVPYDINDPEYPDMNYGYDPLYIPAGLHHFDGTLALKYARTRHADSDFQRAARQQQVLMAVRRKALSLGFMDLLRRAPDLYRQVEEGIRTDLGLDQMLSLAVTLNDIPQENIRSAVLDGNYVTSYRAPNGAAVLLLRQEVATPLINSLFYD
jgi:LCP family protein required for cell wall assembly